MREEPLGEQNHPHHDPVTQRKATKYGDSSLRLRRTAVGHPISTSSIRGAPPQAAANVNVLNHLRSSCCAVRNQSGNGKLAGYLLEDLVEVGGRVGAGDAGTGASRGCVIGEKFRCVRNNAGRGGDILHG